MVLAQEIYEIVEALTQRHGTRNPLTIAKNLGIHIYYPDNFTKLLGMYMHAYHNSAIFLNDQMSEPMILMVAAHELGHDQLHRDQIKYKTFKDFNTSMLKDPNEYEANAFAAHLLMQTDQFMEYANAQYTPEQIAASMNTNRELVIIKQNELIKLGYPLNIPEPVPGNFFSKISKFK